MEFKGDLRPTTWSTLSLSAKALLPVLARHMNDRSECWPGEDRLSAMAGLTPKTVRAAANELAGAGLLRVKSITTRTGRRGKLYSMTQQQADDKFVAFPAIHIDGGNWACLSPAAKALAVPFIYFAKPRPDLDPDEESWLDADEYREYLDRRDFDFTNAEPSVLREFAGLGRRVYNEAIISLKEYDFIAPHDDLYWRVFVWPPSIRKASYLNSKIDGVPF